MESRIEHTQETFVSIQATNSYYPAWFPNILSLALFDSEMRSLWH
jgi:hypothetical protein